MATTFLDLTNKLLRRLNEAQVTSAEFPSLRGLSASAKDFITDAIDEIQAKEARWPFNASAGTETLVVGQELYDYNPLTTVVDWESFCIQKDDTLGVRTTPLTFINQDEWYKRLKPRDEDAGVSGLQIPRYVFQAHHKKFGVSPSPDAAYTVTYDRFVLPPKMQLYTDVSTIPSEFDYVIIDHALVLFNQHKDNADQMNLATSRAKESLSQMRMAYIDRQDKMSDSRTNFGGMPWYWGGNYHV